MTSKKADRSEIVALCSQGDGFAGLQRAYAAEDHVGMLVVSVFDVPNLARLNLLIDTGQSQLATEVVLAGIERHDEDDRLTSLAYEALTERSANLPLSARRAEELLEWVGTHNSELDPEQASQILRWVALEHRPGAIEHAAAHIADRQPDAPNVFDLEAVRLLGRDAAATSTTNLLAYGQRFLDANAPTHHEAVVTQIHGLTPDALTETISQLGRYSRNNWPLGEPWNQLLGRLTIDQVRQVGRAVPDEVTEAWFTGHMLPRLQDLHAADLVDTLGEDWWQPQSLTWMISSAPWDSPALLKRMVQSVKQRADNTTLSLALARVRTEVEAADPGHAVKSAMPRFGARLLLNEALRGTLEPGAADLVASLKHLESALRVAEYQDANWKNPARARALGEILAHVNLEEVNELAQQLDQLDSPARTAFISACAPALSSELAEWLADELQDDEPALAALAAGDTGGAAVLERWAGTQHMPSFRALALSDRSEARLDDVPKVIRTYPAPVGSGELAELLEAVEEGQDRLKMVLDVVSDWEQHPGPSDGTLIVTLDVVRAEVEAGTWSEQTVELLGRLCRQHPKLAVRRSAYAALAEAPPSAEAVDLLAERLADETTTGRPAVRAAVDQMTARLSGAASDDDPHRAVIAVALLKRLNPADALPHARRLATTATAPDDLVQVVQIIAQHGDRGMDPSLLQSMAEGDAAHPDKRVRTEAKRAIRRLEIGDLEAAHERVGDLAGKDPEEWNALDPVRLFGAWGDPLREGLDRVAENEGAEVWGQAIDQLGEVAKVLLFRALELVGVEDGISEKLVNGATSNTLDYGSALGTQQLLTAWPWAHHFAALYSMRTEHIAARGGQTTPPKHQKPDYDHALRLFRDGAGPCCNRIRAGAP